MNERPSPPDIFQANNLALSGTSSLHRWQLPIHTWYFLTAPPEAPKHAPLVEREASRRGRLASVLIFFVILLLVPAALSAIGDPTLLISLSGAFLIDILALAVNRRGKTTLAAILVIISIEAGLAFTILTIPGGLGLGELPLLDLTLQAAFVTASLLPPGRVFLVALINILFFLVVLNLGPINPALAVLFKINGSRVLSIPITLQIIVAIVTYLWASSTNNAIKRADRAEEIVALEQREIEQKRQLEIGIQNILHTHVEVANGNFTARAPLGKENILWQIASSLNNLLARLQGYNQIVHQYQYMQRENAQLTQALQSNRLDQQELQRTKEAAAYLINAMKSGRRPSAPLKSNTIIDAIALQVQNPVLPRPTVEQEPKNPRLP